MTYQLKSKNARAVFSEMRGKAGAFPFNIRALEDEKRARMGLQEATQHALVKPYEVMCVSPVPSIPCICLTLCPSISFTPANTFVAAFHFTIALLPSGPTLVTSPPVWYKPELLKTDKELEDEELKTLLTKKLREDKKKNKKKKAAGEGEGGEEAATEEAKN